MKKEIKYIITFIVALLIRLLPFRAPNLEPIMAIQMPLSKKGGIIISFLFGFLSILIYDIITMHVGVWTYITAFMYGIVGVFAFYYFKNRSGWMNYATFAVIGTIFYDTITGLTIGPLFFHQSFLASFIGQIPFTVIHLLGNVSFAIIVSPIVEKWFLKESVSVRKFSYLKSIKI